MVSLCQLLKKLIQCGDTSCLRPLLALARPKDKELLQAHCHTASQRVLVGTTTSTATNTSTSTSTNPNPDTNTNPNTVKEEGVLREAVAYLSIAIMASGEIQFYSLHRQKHTHTQSHTRLLHYYLH
jgi:hypothetical protein